MKLSKFVFSKTKINLNSYLSVFNFVTKYFPNKIYFQLIDFLWNNMNSSLYSYKKQFKHMLKWLDFNAREKQYSSLYCCNCCHFSNGVIEHIIKDCLIHSNSKDDTLFLKIDWVAYLHYFDIFQNITIFFKNELKKSIDNYKFEQSYYYYYYWMNNFIICFEKFFNYLSKKEKITYVDINKDYCISLKLLDFNFKRIINLIWIIFYDLYWIHFNKK